VSRVAILNVLQLHAIIDDPLVLNGILASNPGARCLVEGLLEDVNALATPPLHALLVEAENDFSDLNKDLCVLVTIEGQVSNEHTVHDAAGTPHVRLMVVAPLQNLWGDVVGRTVDFLQLLSDKPTTRGGGAEVYYLDEVCLF